MGMKLLAVILLLCPQIACAELTDTEKAQVENLSVAAFAVENSERTLISQVRAGNSTAVDRWASLAYTQSYLTRATLLLIHADPDYNAGSTFSTRPVADWVAAAWAALDIARSGLADLGVTDAVNQIDLVDRSLGYANPWPRNYPRVIGPHGFWDDAVGHLAQSFAHIEESHRAAIAAFRVGVDPGLVAGLIEPLIEVADVARSAALNFALIPLTTEQCAMNPFHLVAQALGPLTNDTSHLPGGAPYFFETSFEALFPVVVAVQSRPVAASHLYRFLSVFFRVWRSQNGAAWQALIFPNAATLDQIRGQNAVASDPFAPPCAEARCPERW